LGNLEETCIKPVVRLLRRKRKRTKVREIGRRRTTPGGSAVVKRNQRGRKGKRKLAKEKPRNAEEAGGGC